MWDVYVCESKQCQERGAGATLGAFVGLSPPEIMVHPAIISKAKGKGPNIRCIERGANGRSFEVNNVDSVEKVHRILTNAKYMQVQGVDPTACECLKWNYRGNAHLDKGEISQAIKAYDRAIETGYQEQEGVILVMRATAYLQRAFNHRKELKAAVKALAETVPDPADLQTLYQLGMENPSISNQIFTKVVADCKVQSKKFQQTKFRHGLYEYALLHATQDSLKATQLLPQYAKTWLRAGDSLAELRKLKESAQYYEKALELDPSLADTLVPTIDRLKKSQQFLDKARAIGWPEDTLRVALDVAG